MDKHDEPDRSLAALLATDVTGLNETRTLNHLREISRAQARLEALRLQAIEHFSALRAHAGDVPDRLARELKLTRHNAAKDVKLAHAVTFRLPRTLTELETGTLDAARVAQVERATRELTDTQARSVDNRLYPAAVEKNPKPLGDLLRGAVAQENPEIPQKRGEKRRPEPKCGTSTAQPGADRFKALMAELDLVEIDRAINGVARYRKYRGDPRTLDELRLVVMRDRLLGKERVPLLTHVHVWATAETLAGFSDLAGHMRGYGLIPAHRVRELALSGSAVWTVADASSFEDHKTSGRRPAGTTARVSRTKLAERIRWRPELSVPWLTKARRRKATAERLAKLLSMPAPLGLAASPEASSAPDTSG